MVNSTSASTYLADLSTVAVGFIGVTLVLVLLLGAGIAYLHTALAEHRQTLSRRDHVQAEVRAIRTRPPLSEPRSSSAATAACQRKRVLISGSNGRGPAVPAQPRPDP
jgi:hypothetical protein